MTEVVLDASALLARILCEPGSEKVDAVIDRARISSVNFAEVVQRLVDRGMDDGALIAVLGTLPCPVESLDQNGAFRTGVLRRTTRDQGLSLGDRACLELAERLALPAITADRAWAALDLDVEVVLIR
jgi:ribonuclease VapC